MELFRLSRIKYKNVLSGIGASAEGGRWNSKGVEMVYTSSSRALAMAEVAVHTSYSLLKNDYLMVPIYVPDNIRVVHIVESDLPKFWSIFPSNKYLEEIGNDFIDKNTNCILKVPSAIVKNDYNYLLNPFHADFGRIYALDSERFQFDKRIFQDEKFPISK